MSTQEAAQGRRWSQAETLAALHVYLLLPFGQLHKNQPRIKQTAAWLRRTPSSVALKLVNFASLDPQIVASGRHGMANASRQDEAIWEALKADWDQVAKAAAAQYEQLARSAGEPEHADVREELVDLPPEQDWEGRTRTATMEVRVDQARFRKSVLAGYDSTCCISGLRHPKLVIASHIVPWSEDAANRLNPQNGLCLSALHDRAFDRGLITVMPTDFRVRVSPQIAQHPDDFLRDALARFDGAPIRMPERFRPDPAFLAKHAQHFGFL